MKDSNSGITASSRSFGFILIMIKVKCAISRCLCKSPLSKKPFSSSKAAAWMRTDLPDKVCEKFVDILLFS